MYTGAWWNNITIVLHTLPSTRYQMPSSNSCVPHTKYQAIVTPSLAHNHRHSHMQPQTSIEAQGRSNSSRDMCDCKDKEADRKTASAFHAPK